MVVLGFSCDDEFGAGRVGFLLDRASRKHWMSLAGLLRVSWRSQRYTALANACVYFQFHVKLFCKKVDPLKSLSGKVTRFTFEAKS